ncbi:tetrathionate reductase subunit C [Yersinia enterocolitica]|uniref:Tetrathionate reductase subunit C n=1 Tax=Yersinia enterocolitica serotype O:8 / biotype 1B (strain NCTC 13174 / 8081) TaxID=393305 RepID=A1JN24_YERE8|nr:tetrathionate reductase subunit TtrC [Yersinia enterocolitica]AJI81297.1 polysulfide reductase, NrfD family protein [Yersinia enterocolitica]AJJ22426.1 polysulfide reductase, NrfD family protein [Yersinia enterocolitica]EKA27407.1 tetrathionate reductase subunit C [Yersinia enterocolitica subsp. enterocolitica WA-314]ELI8284833.1 tetrathionate reductase subunit TtrC [Yersinia enterocolitica]KGA71089.1 polysulfide reductase, NrfD family protein [Yersinia enterocolitica]
MIHETMIREILARPQDIAWLPWAVQYFFFIGLACSAVLFAGGQRICARQGKLSAQQSQWEFTALMLAVTAVVVAPLALNADLHQPARVWHFYAHFTPWSWMSWGSIFLPLFSLLVMGYFLALIYSRLKAKPLPRLLAGLALLCGLSAISILLYTGREVSILRAQPLWFSLWLPLFIFLTACQAIPSLLALWLWREPQYQRPLARWQLISLVVLAWVTLLWVYSDKLWASGDNLSAPALRHWAVQSPFIALFPLALWLLLFGLALFNGRKTLSTPVIATQALIALTLCWSVRWLLLMQTQTLPKYNVLANPYTLPLGSEGLLAIIGTFGLWVAAIIAIREGVKWLEQKVTSANRVEGEIHHG